MVPQLCDFEGLWQMERALTDTLAGQTGLLVGTAQFTPAAQGLRYSEEGQLSYAGQPPLTATRSYLWRESEGRIAVFFTDGTAFHDFDPRASAAQHFCDPDQYDVTYDFSHWPLWQAKWAVSGPRKSYVTHTVYTRTA